MAARLLLVDDDELNRDVLSRRLSRGGYDVITAVSGAGALASLETHPIDLVLLDLLMPDMSGLEVLERIRRNFPPSLLPVIMVTATPESEGIGSALRLGANDYITKPVDFQIALARIETRLSLAATSRAQKQAGDLYRLAAITCDEGLWDWDMQSGTLYSSPRWKAILGLAEDGACGVDAWFERIHPRDRARWGEQLDAHLHGRSTGIDCEFRVRHEDGRYRWVECRGSASRDGGEAAVRVSGQMTEMAAAKLVDAATGLPNRRWLEAELEEDGPPQPALILLELDGLARYRASLPQEDARRIVQAAAARLGEALQGRAAQLACTAEGQFAVLIRPSGPLEEVRHLASKLKGALYEGDVYCGSASVGIAAEVPGGAAETLLRDAQAALRHTRDDPAKGAAVFQESMRRRDLEELRLEVDLLRAMERGEMVVYYQPKVDLEDSAIAGFEALVRWNRPGFGLVLPTQFIPLAERSGLIVPLGLLVLERACLDTAGLRRSFPRVRVSVNVSGRQFAEPDLLEQVKQSLENAGLEPGALQVEVTETAAIVDMQAALGIMNRLRAMGVGLKLDDFGEGYSSLTWLRQFPFDTLKIDRAFVTGMGHNAEGLAIVRTIIALARSLQLELVAEGIERREQADLLRSMGCRYGQGFWFSRPVELARLRELLAGWKLPGSSVLPQREALAV